MGWNALYGIICVFTFIALFLWFFRLLLLMIRICINVVNIIRCSKGRSFGTLPFIAFFSEIIDEIESGLVHMYARSIYSGQKLFAICYSLQNEIRWNEWISLSFQNESTDLKTKLKCVENCFVRVERMSNEEEKRPAKLLLVYANALLDG